MKTLKLIVAGGRDFNDYFLLEQNLNEYLIDFKDYEIEIVSGTARGADTLGEQYARNHKLSVMQIPADWNMHGKAAGPIRNEQMAVYADRALVFWDRKSKGSKHMIDTMNKIKKPVDIVYYDK